MKNLNSTLYQTRNIYSKKKTSINKIFAHQQQCNNQKSEIKTTSNTHETFIPKNKTSINKIIVNNHQHRDSEFKTISNTIYNHLFINQESNWQVHLQNVHMALQKKWTNYLKRGGRNGKVWHLFFTAPAPGKILCFF